jgi:energy-coupling factor transport system substrate-specific component
MWKNVRMVVLAAVVAALYAAAYIAFSPLSINLIPGVLSISVRDVFILVLGTLFGPAGAVGLGIGNVVGDFFTGSLGIGSTFGFLTNAFVAIVGYSLWSRTRPDGVFRLGRSRVAEQGWFAIVVVISAGAGTVPLAWGLDLLGVAPFKIIAVTLFLNLIIGGVIGGLLYLELHDRVSRLGMTWTEVMPGREVSAAISAPLGVVLMALGGVGGTLAGLLLTSSGALVPVVGIFFLVLVIGVVLV